VSLHSLRDEIGSPVRYEDVQHLGYFPGSEFSSLGSKLASVGGQVIYLMSSSDGNYQWKLLMPKMNYHPLVEEITEELVVATGILRHI